MGDAYMSSEVENILDAADLLIILDVHSVCNIQLLSYHILRHCTEYCKHLLSCLSGLESKSTESNSTNSALEHRRFYDPVQSKCHLHNVLFGIR